ncbi:hypothetical protein ACFY05_02270 [Microtetraspora fusca]|uniref:Uncharacterized protein n=1 Tax=Microtetraspora fusca TaxID=1997 RepID=A0ABW6UY77_MICFU
MHAVHARLAPVVHAHVEFLLMMAANGGTGTVSLHGVTVAAS